MRGKGLLIGCVLTDEYNGRAREFLKAAEKQQLMILVAGLSVLRLAPSLVISDADIDEGLKRLDAAIADLQSAK
ncbi:Succinylornithine transaminase/acetylornithine aminotransferase [Chromobacterium violaceum]|uniref:Succinylornithine transaminase/acetylornithine aminotransferase n=1 Tax=Chromobacterium violaceum TaxID=536 RepID=A0A447T9T5_CHRVL|nr:Succinylornithine transaminase/acetylornithine aminotransferase [Chromobacterium violaceum]